MYIRRRPPNPSIKVANLEYSIPHSEGIPKNILEEIVWEKDREINLSKQKVPLENLKSQISELPPTKGFRNKLSQEQSLPAVIAEIKKASPSKGVIRKNFNPGLIANSYQKGGASCLSVLTDKNFFQGGFDVLVEVRKAVNLPILCKDFILMPYQIFQARAAGADAILLIASILSDQDLTYLKKVADGLNLDVLVEVHNDEEMERVLKISGFSLIGINNRDLMTFQTDLNTTEIISKKFKGIIKEKNILLVSESGIKNNSDFNRLKAAGAKAVLVGESLMSQDDICNGLINLITGKDR